VFRIIVLVFTDQVPWLKSITHALTCLPEEDLLLDPPVDVKHTRYNTPQRTTEIERSEIATDSRTISWSTLWSATAKAGHFCFSMTKTQA
jgi:hypothetical protein